VKCPVLGELLDDIEEAQKGFLAWFLSLFSNGNDNSFALSGIVDALDMERIDRLMSYASHQLCLLDFQLQEFSHELKTKGSSNPSDLFSLDLEMLIGPHLELSKCCFQDDNTLLVVASLRSETSLTTKITTHHFAFPSGALLDDRSQSFQMADICIRDLSICADRKTIRFMAVDSSQVIFLDSSQLEKAGLEIVQWDDGVPCQDTKRRLQIVVDDYGCLTVVNR